MKPVTFGCVVFGATGLAGPIVWLASDTSRPWDNPFLDELLFYLWPGRLLAFGDDRSLRSAATAVGANLVLFLALGPLAAFAARWRGMAAATYWCFALLLLLWGLWGAGSDTRFLDVPPLLAALGINAVPFWLVDRAARRNGPARQEQRA